MKIFKTKKELRSYLKNIDRPIVFVPTMGNLHYGHLSLLKVGQNHYKQDENIAFVVSLFVNPKQFGPNEDLDKYPRTLEQDLEKLQSLELELNGDIILYQPEVQDIYPGEILTEIRIPQLMNCLCATSRPNFFPGILTVISRLLSIVEPNVIVMGKKDYQQYLIIKRYCQDICLDCEVLGGDLIREEHGLAMSSRNNRLTEQERQDMVIIYQSLQEVRQTCIEQGNFIEKIEEIKTKFSKEFNLQTDYFEVRDKDLNLVTKNVKKGYILFFAGYLRDVRLIDNLEI